MMAMTVQPTRTFLMISTQMLRISMTVNVMSHMTSLIKLGSACDTHLYTMTPMIDSLAICLASSMSDLAEKIFLKPSIGLIFDSLGIIGSVENKNWICATLAMMAMT